MNKLSALIKKPLFWVIAAAVVLVIALAIILPLLIGGNVTCHATLTVEAGTALPAPADFLQTGTKKEITYITDVSAISPNVPGSYPVELRCGKQTLSSTILIRDTVAPTAVPQPLTVYNPQTVKAEDMVTDLQDVTQVSIRFETNPDLTVAGDQTVALLLTDLGSNTTRLETTLTVVLDTEAPIIAGAGLIEVYTGDSIAYRDGITVTDDQDPAPKLDIDSSAVNLAEPGQYSITYTATDHAGNVSTAEGSVIVYAKAESFVPPEEIYAAVDAILAELITEDMTDYQKVKTVFWWIRHNTTYVNMQNPKDWMQVGYQTLTRRRGDCYSFFALNKLMLERMGIPNIDVAKVKRHQWDGGHYWSLVSVDGGQTYYHVDITPRQDDTIFLMVTDGYLADYAKKELERKLFTFTTEDGFVTAESDGNQTITKLTFNPEALKPENAEALSTDVLAAIAGAKKEAAKEDHISCFDRDMSLYPATPTSNYRE